MGNCQACGFKLIIHNHHPEGKNWEKGSNYGEYKNPDNVIELCPICHHLIGKRDYSLKRARREVHKFWKDFFNKTDSKPKPSSKPKTKTISSSKRVNMKAVHYSEVMIDSELEEKMGW